MALVSLREVTLGYGGPPLIENVTLQIERGERIALLGRNGVGKSTLLKLLNGEVAPDGGDAVRAPGLRTARLLQEVPVGSHGTVHDVVMGGAAEVSSERAAWQVEQQVDQVISRLGLDPTREFESLSSGMKRRVLLARTLASEPEILLLDEPTNHLDVESILWLEEFLGRFPGTLIFVTHDRVFMQKLATRIIELERGRVFDWTCDYPTFLKRRQAMLEAEAKQQENFDRKLAEEEVWIRTGIKARRTRNEGRVRALEELRKQHAARRQQMGTVKAQVQEAEKSGRLVVDAKNISFAYEQRPIVKDLSITLMRGDKVGILGPNGCGKTTLLRLLLCELKPDAGTVRQGTKVEIAYFDQLRAQIDEEKTVQENVSSSQTVVIDGKTRHIIGYLQDFLFSAERARSPARYLSGGERNRLLLAKLFTKPSNVMVLDEPTNDLDTETLELLESLLVDYGGTVLLVSHDRAFLDNVVTSVLSFEGDGIFKEYEGGYDDWRRSKEAAARIAEEAARSAAAASTSSTAKRKDDRPKKLSFREQQELERLPDQIASLESEQKSLHDTMADPAFYKQDSGKIAVTVQRLEKLQAELATAYERWELLEERVS
ncbi:MAG: ATP-binding cassette domain-containing protein [Planctomycetaceae bacterium]|nr:ATP-binding cassette domain-containing protein [Planctomycetaceae bacterium]